MDMPLLLKLMNALGQLRKHEHWTRAQLEAYQESQLHQAAIPKTLAGKALLVKAYQPLNTSS